MAVIRDIMSRVVISVRPDATLMSAVKTLTRHHISGAPVVTPQGHVVGFISEANLMDVLFDAAARQARVSDFMSREVHLVDSQDSIVTAAKMLAVYGIRRLPVVEQGRFIGVVTRRDLLAYALRHDEPLDEPLLELIPELCEFS